MKIGDRSLLSKLEMCPHGLSYRACGVDIIGGNGTTARVARMLLEPEDCPYIMSADPCSDMVTDAHRQGLPALWQPAQKTLFASDTLDFCLASRGLHHIDRESRQQAVSEAHRILKPQGMIMLIDFEEGTPTARWYSEGLDRYTSTGHRFDHFSVPEFRELLSNAGFNNISVQPLYDPFVFRGRTPIEARNKLLAHKQSMFGMVNLKQEAQESAGDFWDRIDGVFSQYAAFTPADVSFDSRAVNRFTVFQERAGVWRAEFPRVALCATAIK